LFFLGQQRLQDIRGGASVPRIVFLGQQRLQDIRGGASVPQIVFSGQQCLQVIRGRASIPRIVFFGPAMSSKCSSSSCGPLNHPFRACSATMLFGYRHLNPRNASLGC
jgi:hypothetical protein